MTENHQSNQPNLFDLTTENVEIEKVLLYALGEFQSRGKILAARELPLDRLRGAFKRAAEKFEIEEFSDESLARNLEKLGAKIVKVPSFVAKHPFRITVSAETARKAAQFYNEKISKPPSGEKS
ncbi:MAG TPA: hypothetical protein VNI84_13145 [Pyrinomonadaceae bacterium]|nr:hypothetical protein [Pyrinomonadaceae bacterium]